MTFCSMLMLLYTNAQFFFFFSFLFFFLRCMSGYNTLGGACDYFFFYASLFICFSRTKEGIFGVRVLFQWKEKKGIQKGKYKRC